MNDSRSVAILIIIGLLILGAAAYLFMNQNQLGSAVATLSGPASGAEETFVRLTSQIDPVELDTSILSDPRFTSLEDIRTAIIPEASGRPDPFAPLGR